MHQEIGVLKEVVLVPLPDSPIGVQQSGVDVISVTRLGNFLKFMVTYFFPKVTQIWIDFVIFFGKHPF